MKSYRFSPIKNEEQLLEAITYTHVACFELCKKVFGRYLPAAGNIGIFCHFDYEYEFLTKVREKLTIESNNWNQKYYRLHEPIVIPAKDGVQDTTYTYLYIRKPDQHTEVGDVDFVLNKKEYSELKNSLLDDAEIKGMKIFERPNLDLVKLFDPDIDVLSFISKETMAENIGIKQNT